MKKKFLTAAIALTLVGSISFTSCIGSFGLTNKIYSWNNSVGDKWVNEIVFLALCILPVYEITILVDGVLLNSIEFWTGNNPVAAGEVKQVEGENGIYTVETLENGYQISNEEGEEMSLLYNEATKTWSSVAGDQNVDLITIQDDNSVLVYLPNGETKSVEASENGLMALRQYANAALFASK